jgi:exo-1,4-beta-D-glucosaminidase
MISSDELPPKSVESTYLSVFEAEPWPAAVLSAASQADSNLTGPTGVKMSGPYSWVPPVYWSSPEALNNGYGGAWGFLTEGGPGENPLALESLVITLPTDELWPNPMNDEWDLHCGNPDGLFYDLRYFIPPLYERYGNASSVADFSMKSQVAVYESHRAMFEGYTKGKCIFDDHC